MRHRPAQKKSLLLIIVSIGLTLIGCSGQQIKDRSEQLGQGLRFQIGAGIGLYGEVQATSWIHPAIGFADANLSPRYTIGWDPRPQQPAGTLRTAAFPSLILGFPFYSPFWEEVGFGESYSPKNAFLAPWILMGNHYVEGESCSLFQLHRQIPNPLLSRAIGLEQLTAKQQRSRDSWIAISGTIGLVTFDIGINPLEIFDTMKNLISVETPEDTNVDDSSLEENDRKEGEIQ